MTKTISLFLVALLCFSAGNAFAARAKTPVVKDGVRILSSHEVGRLHGLMARAMDRRQVSRSNEARGTFAVSTQRHEGVYNPGGRRGYVGAVARLDVRGVTGSLDMRPRALVVHARANVNLTSRLRRLHTVWVYLRPRDGTLLSAHVVTKVEGKKTRRLNLTAQEVAGSPSAKRAFGNAVRLSMRWLREGPRVNVQALSRFIARRI